jgi:hypothetical protein
MFVSKVARVLVPFDEAIARVSSYLDNLAGWAHGAYRAGEQVQTRLGTGNPVIAKRVLLEIGQPTRTPRELKVPIAWRATVTPHLFPRMEATLVLSPATDNATHITFAGTYSVPFGTVGEFFEETLLHRVAERTVENFVEQISEALEQP